MRIRFQTLTKILPAVLLAAMATTASAQIDNSADATISRTTSSRIRFVPTNMETPVFPKLQTNTVSVSSFGVLNPVEDQNVTPVVALIPQKDASTSPRRMAPSVNSAAFHAPVQQQIAPPRQAAVPEPPIAQPQAESTYFTIPQADIGSTHFPMESNAPYYDGENADEAAISIYNTPRSQEMVFDPSYGYGAIALGSATGFVRTTSQAGYFSPFAIDDTECCDEWECFCNCNRSSWNCECGGLKAKPGHLGVKWLRGKDACEKTQRCRDKRCNSKTGSGCKSGCNGNCGDSKCGLKGRCKGNQECDSDCDCNAKTSKGLFGRK